MWNYQGTKRNSTGMEGVNMEILIPAQGIQHEKRPSPPHSGAPLIRVLEETKENTKSFKIVLFDSHGSLVNRSQDLK